MNARGTAVFVFVYLFAFLILRPFGGYKHYGRLQACDICLLIGISGLITAIQLKSDTRKANIIMSAMFLLWALAHAWPDPEHV